MHGCQGEEITMVRSAYSGPEDCNCLAVRQAARHITQFYDQFLAPSGLRTTLGRNILPLERDGLIAVKRGSRDRRSKELRVTEAGEARFRAGVEGWVQAQRQFEKAFGAKRTADMRALLHTVAATDLSIKPVSVAE